MFEQVASQQHTLDGLQSTSDGPPIAADVGTPTHEPEISTPTHEAENEEKMTENQCILEKDFPFYLFNSVTPQNIDQLPPDIKGKKIYKMKSGPQTWKIQQYNHRNFKMNTSHSITLHGKRKIGFFRGQLYCANNCCTFLNTAGKQNTVHIGIT